MERFNPVVLDRHSSKQEREYALWQIYAQVLERQPYEFERKNLFQMEKNFLQGKTGVRRFLKELGHSDLYLNIFYYSASNPKFVETCCKHFLGRSVRDHDEMRFYIKVLSQSGVYQLVTTILDSEEYRKYFGGFTVPYPQREQYKMSPNEYLETTVVQKEHFGRRGWALPALYWHHLGLDCDGGVCLYIGDEPSAATYQTISAPKPQQSEELQEELMDLLMAL
ncbi:MAG: phycobilisome rod-core linker polypeptide [Leptolyngbyaceae bacterium]|nr:phycobilisome rod-core linker polypeptide [Leptolyngbyaceae bacterium]